jgi:hypothetical protein
MSGSGGIGIHPMKGKGYSIHLIFRVDDVPLPDAAFKANRVVNYARAARERRRQRAHTDARERRRLARRRLGSSTGCAFERVMAREIG